MFERVGVWAPRSGSRRRARRIVLAVLALAALAAPVSAADDPDPFPLGACVRSTMVDPRPVCLMVDPAP